MLPGVPQVIGLGPILFLIYKNDLADDLQSNINLFADDCALNQNIESEEDSSLK